MSLNLTCFNFQHGLSINVKFSFFTRNLFFLKSPFNLSSIKILCLEFILEDLQSPFKSALKNCFQFSGNRKTHGQLREENTFRVDIQTRKCHQISLKVHYPKCFGPNTISHITTESKKCLKESGTIAISVFTALSGGGLCFALCVAV